MNSKTLFVVVLVVVLIVVLYTNYYSTENYSASFDEKYIDPRVSDYSRNVSFRPDTNALTDDYYDSTGTPSYQVYDHLDDQERGNGVDMLLEEDVPVANEVAVKRVRFADEVDENGQTINKAHYPTSYYRKQIYKNRVNESNNIVGYCSKDEDDVYMNNSIQDVNTNLMNNSSSLRNVQSEMEENEKCALDSIQGDYFSLEDYEKKYKLD